MNKLTLFWLRLCLSCFLSLFSVMYVNAAPDDVSGENEASESVSTDETLVEDDSTSVIVGSEDSLGSSSSVADSFIGGLKEFYIDSGLSYSVTELKDKTSDAFNSALDILDPYFDPILDKLDSVYDTYKSVAEYSDKFWDSVKEKSKDRKDNKRDELVIVEGDGLTGWLDEYLDHPVADTGVELPDGSTLSYNDKKQLSTWISVLSLNREDSKYKYLRIVRILVGILLIIYSVVFFICYWVDRFNTLIDISFLSLISFGKFMASVDNEVSTYRGKEKGVKLLNFRNVLCVSLGFLLLGILILSGALYRLVVWCLFRLSK